MKKIIFSILYIQLVSIMYAADPEASLIVSDNSQGYSNGQYSFPKQAMSDELAHSLLAYAPDRVQKLVNHAQNEKASELTKINRLFLYGPSGSGKTDLCIAVAKILKYPLTIVDAIDIENEYQHSVSNELNRIFDPIFQSKDKHAVLIDEMTCLIEEYDEGSCSREKNAAVGNLCKIVDKCMARKNVLFMATGHSIERVPQSIKSRFSSKMIKVDLPEVAARKAILMFYLPPAHNCSEKYVQHIAEKTRGFCSRLLKGIIRDAEGKAILRGEYDGKVTDEDLKAALAMQTLPDHPFIAYCKEHKKEIVYYSFQALPLIVTAFQIYLNYINVQNQNAALELQQRSLEIARLSFKK